MSITTGNITINTHFTEAVIGTPGASPLSTHETAGWSVTGGTAADQADLKYSKTLTFVASTPQVLDLTNLTDFAGNVISLARVKSLLIINNSQVTGQVLTLGYAATTTNAWTALFSNPGQLVVRSSTAANEGAFLAIAPGTTAWAVTSASKLLNLDPGSSAFTATVEIVGSSL